MDQILEWYEDVVGIADDITMHGCTEEHDARPYYMQIWLSIQQEQTCGEEIINFFRHIYSVNGVHLNPV